MRQQYHFREVDAKRLIWNINKRVEWSKDFSIQFTEPISPDYIDRNLDSLPYED